jgi:PAS domain-containing protein
LAEILIDMYMNSFGEITTVVGAVGGGSWWTWSKLINPFLKKEKQKKALRWKKLDDIHKEMQMDGNGSIKTAIVELKNTTKRIEGRLNDIEQNQKVSMNLQGLPYWVSDKAGEITYVSPALCKLIGRSESELLGRNWVLAIAPDDRKRVLEAWQFSVENEAAFDEIYSIKTRDGLFQKVWGVAFPKIGQNVFDGTLGKLTPIEAPYHP